jgi:hypothetical protein
VDYWTPEQIAVLHDSLAAGMTTSAIAQKIGRSKNSVIGKVHRMKHRAPAQSRAQPTEWPNEWERAETPADARWRAFVGLLRKNS